METQRIDPHKVTKPIQLLAAWLTGLVIVDAGFLMAARLISNPPWLPAVLVLAAIVNVPIFLSCIFLLQTKFRPEMQEDTYYSLYLDKKLIAQTQEAPNPTDTLVANAVERATSKSSKLMDEIRLQFTELTSAIQELRQATSTETALHELIEDVQQKERLFEARLKRASQRIESYGTSVEINTFLPQYDDICSALGDAGVSISSRFGSHPPPETFDLGFGIDVPAELLQAVIRALLPFGLCALSIAEGSMHSRRIYIGSYAAKNSPETVHRLYPAVKERILTSGLSTAEVIKEIRETAPNKSVDADNQ